MGATRDGTMTAARPMRLAGRRGRVLATLCAVVFLTFLDTTIVSVALADVQSTLHAGVAALQWVVSGYALVFASLMLAAGVLGDRLGRKRIMLGGLAVFCAGSLLGALAPGSGVLIAARAIMGLGAAASEPGTLSIIRQLYAGVTSARRRLVPGLPSPAWHWRWDRSSAACWSVSAAGAASSGSTSWRAPPSSSWPSSSCPRAPTHKPHAGTSPALSSAPRRWPA